MAKPTAPVVPGMKLPVTEIAKDQAEYMTLPAFIYDDGTVLSRWKLTWRERLLVLLRGDVFLWVSTFDNLLQPVKITIERPCTRPPTGWWCSRGEAHEGPCAAREEA